MTLLNINSDPPITLVGETLVAPLMCLRPIQALISVALCGCDSQFTHQLFPPLGLAGSQMFKAFVDTKTFFPDSCTAAVVKVTTPPSNASTKCFVKVNVRRLEYPALLAQFSQL